MQMDEDPPFAPSPASKHQFLDQRLSLQLTKLRACNSKDAPTHDEVLGEMPTHLSLEAERTAARPFESLTTKGTITNLLIQTKGMTEKIRNTEESPVIRETIGNGDLLT